MDAILFILLLTFFAGSIEDFRKREVSDWTTLFAWFLVYLLVPDLHLFVLAFVMIWIASLLIEKIFKKPMLGWADILWFPPFVAAIAYLHGDYFRLPLIMLGISQLLLSLIKRGWIPKLELKKGIPLVHVMFGVLLALAIVREMGW